jgi:hypothetical protein
MNRLRSVEVEPLSDQRWTKIEDAVFSRLEVGGNQAVLPPESRRPSLRTWGLIAAALAALAVVAFVIGGLPGGTVMDAPSRIATGTSASHLTLPGLSLDVEPQSTVVVQAETARGTLIVLDRGTIVCEVAPRSSEAPLIVQAGATRVRVVGTRFSVTRVGESARVNVQRGAVEVTSRGETWRVSAGEEWPRSADPHAVQGAGANTEKPAGPGSAAPDLPRTTPEQPESTLENVDSERVATTGGRRAGSRPRPERDESGSSVAQPDPVAPVDAVESESVEPEAARNRQPSRQALFEEATALERSDPARASELYRSLESRADSWAQNALYARGRLAASRGNAGEARRLLQQYLQRFPNGSNAEDARAVLRRLR